MVLTLDREQRKSIYQLLAQRNLEQYQGDIELLLCGYLSPETALKLLFILCEETKRQTTLAMTERENRKLEAITMALYGGKT